MNSHGSTEFEMHVNTHIRTQRMKMNDLCRNKMRFRFVIYVGIQN